MAARQPLELFGLGSNPGGGAVKRANDLALFERSGVRLTVTNEVLSAQI
jgi:hypothetical protein